MMMYDELIKNLRETPSIPVDAKLHNEAADAIEGMQKRLDNAEIENIKLKEEFARYRWKNRWKNRWIPVKERLPEENEVVLVADKANDIGIGSLQPLWHGVVWVVPFEDVDNEFCPISHWMPLPEPPESGEA